MTTSIAPLEFNQYLRSLRRERGKDLLVEQNQVNLWNELYMRELSLLQGVLHWLQENDLVQQYRDQCKLRCTSYVSGAASVYAIQITEAGHGWEVGFADEPTRYPLTSFQGMDKFRFMLDGLVAEVAKLVERISYESGCELPTISV